MHDNFVCLKLTTDMKLHAVTLENDWHDIVRELGCHFFEVVRTDILCDFFSDSNVVMLCDEEGLLNDSHYNPVASTLYGFEIHSNPIFGDVLICLRDGPELVGLSEFQRHYFKSCLLREFDLESSDTVVK